MPLPQVDLTDPALYAEGDPRAVWRTLRAHDPVHWQPVGDALGFWSVTRYTDGGVTGPPRPRPVGFVGTAAGPVDELRMRTQPLTGLPTTALPALPRPSNGKIDHRALDREAQTPTHGVR